MSIFSHILNWFRPILPNYPISGVDAEWLANCDNCNDFTLHVSRGGLIKDSIDHCYGCGYEKPMMKFSKENAKDMVNRSYSHWKDWPKLPYDYHTKNEAEKWEALRPPKNGFAGD